MTTPRAIAIENPRWYDALNLSERRKPELAYHLLSPPQSVRERASRRKKKWLGQRPFDAAGLFDERLATFELTASDFDAILHEPLEALRDRVDGVPAWLSTVRAAFVADGPFTGGPQGSFLRLFWPIIQVGVRRVAATIEELFPPGAKLALDRAAFDASLARDLEGIIAPKIEQTCVLEMHVARLREQLAGETPEARYQSFVELLADPEYAAAILEEYPVLARNIAQVVDLWADFAVEWLTRVHADWDQIDGTLLPGRPDGYVLTSAVRKGDPHRRGRAVLLLTFDDGARLIYKPHGLSVDVQFARLLAWLNQRGVTPPLKSTSVIDKGTYGWAAFVTAFGCQSEAEIQRFYERQGSFLAILYALESTDFHFENLIAHGEHPILVDMESLFHAKIEASRSGPVTATQTTVNRSVLRIGMLPTRSYMSSESEGVDVSGLGAPVEGQLSPAKVPVWEGRGTDNMRLVRKRVKLDGAQNRPSLAGQTVDPAAYQAEILRGFQRTYGVLLKHRDELLAEGGIIDQFAATATRYIARGTGIYARLLMESNHPDLLRSALDRDRFFDKLWLAVPHLPHLKRLIPFEYEDMWYGEVPLFNSQPGSRHLWSCTGVQIDDFFVETGLDQVRRCIKALSTADLKRQSWIIEASFTSLEMGKPHAAHVQIGPRVDMQARRPATPENLTSLARAVGDRLVELAVSGEEDAAWLGVTLVHDRVWTLAQLGFDLYEGMGGVALFLGYLGHVTDEPVYTRLSRKAVRSIRDMLDSIGDRPISLGGMSGSGSVVYTLAHLGTLWQDAELLHTAVEFAARIGDVVHDDAHYDVLSGSAGAILGLVALYRATGAAELLPIIKKCADHLVASAEPMTVGIGWPTRDGVALAGFSHGAAGIAAALIQASDLLNAPAYAEVARAAWAYERSIYDEARQNWPDLRMRGDSADEEPSSHMLAWCHGAPGVGLARLSTIGLVDDESVRAEIHAAVATTLRRGFGGNFSLCHGDLGNLALIDHARRHVDPALERQVEDLKAYLVTAIGQLGFMCGVPMGAETPGLMMGIAGIGYELLRLAQPEVVPSVLMMQPPLIAAA